jgi:hypothetical protein
MSGSQERINRRFDGVAQALFPDVYFRRQVANRYAVEDDGKVNPTAVPVGSLWLHDEQDNGTGASTASTTVYEDIEASTGIILPAFGVWMAVFDGAANCRNSAGAAVDFRLLFNGNDVASINAVAVASGGTYLRKVAKISNLGAGTAIDARVQIKANASGTASASAGIVRLDIHRTS